MTGGCESRPEHLSAAAGRGRGPGPARSRAPASLRQPGRADDEEADHHRVPDRGHARDPGLHRLLSQTQHHAQDKAGHMERSRTGLPGAVLQE